MIASPRQLPNTQHAKQLQPVHVSTTTCTSFCLQPQTNETSLSLSLSHLVAAVTASTSGLRPGRPALVELAQVLHTRRLANEAVHLLLDRHVVAVLGLGEVAPGELGVDAVDNLERPACVRVCVWLID